MHPDMETGLIEVFRGNWDSTFVGVVGLQEGVQRLVVRVAQAAEFSVPAMGSLTLHRAVA